ncbi:hypothetical protein [Lentzea sp. NBRC 102530]|uniref:hypothetical protein n=1 Tax=Lentzea sp. NBRC 102530 TaxID=3032201 RepID=UPI0024A36F7B|nr:hypothetical protein [Lentzea sp. NBRC 102530]GLY48560.1 hypothetical protein Lesp01_22160 [Lentzea sp. NBRC 102530]
MDERRLAQLLILGYFPLIMYALADMNISTNEAAVAAAAICTFLLEFVHRYFGGDDGRGLGGPQALPS